MELNSIMRTEFINQLHEGAINFLVEKGFHHSMLIRNLNVAESVETVIDSDEFQKELKELKELKDGSFALISEAEEDGQKYLITEIWINGKGLMKMTAFNRKKGKVVLGENDFRILGAE